MPEHFATTAQLPLDDALDRLRVYRANFAGQISEQDEPLNAIPVSRQAVADAKARASSASGGEQPVHLPPDPQIAAASAPFRPRDEELQAEQDAVADAFGLLDEADIRRLFDSPSLGNFVEFAIVVACLCRSRNSNAVAPLIERLRRKVAYEPPKPPRESRWRRFIADLDPFFRALQCEAREMNRAHHRTFTIRALELLGDRRAEPAIRSFVRDKNELVRDAARKALEWRAVEAKEEDAGV